MPLRSLARPEVEQQPPDSALILRVRAGDPTALGTLYHRHAGALLAIACRLTGSSFDAEDLVQDLFVGLPEALARYQERGEFAAWLRQIIVRLALMRLRAHRRRRESGLELVDHSADRVRSSDPVWEGLNRLAPDARALVVLKTIEGFSHAEIAALLGIRRNTVEVRFHRAMQRLRRLLEDQ